MIVADTNLISYLLVDGEQTAAARAVWKVDPEWMMPTLWRSEFLNVLTVSVRAKVLSQKQAVKAWKAAVELFAKREREPSGTRVLQTAIRRGISAYDAQFVVVAEELDVPLVTGDRHVLASCPEVALSIEDAGAM